MIANILKQRIQLQEKIIVQGPLGQIVTWKPVQDLHARVISLDVKTIAQYMQLNTVVSHKIMLRGTVEVNLGSHRFLHRDKTYLPQQSAKHYDGVTELVVLEG